MNTNTNQTSNEISLNQVVKRISQFFKKIYHSILSVFSFGLKHTKILLPTLLAGIVVGGILDYLKQPKYSNEIVVATNYGSNEYLYNSINKFNAIKKQLPKKSLISKITTLEITPIKNPYQFLSQSPENITLFSTLSERNINLETYFESKIMEKNFHYHKINVITSAPIDSTAAIINEFLAMLNNNSYFTERQQIETQNIERKKAELYESVHQINDFFKTLGQKSNNQGDVNINQYGGLEHLISKKQELLEQIQQYDIQLIEGKQPIFKTYTTLNSKAFSLPYFIILPIILFFLMSIGIKILQITFKNNRHAA